MKKLFLVAIIAMFSFSNAKAQSGVLNGGINIGLPMGDVDDSYSFNVDAELNYMFTVSEGFTFGPSIEYSHFFGKEISGGGFTFEVPDASFIPLSAAARFNVTQDFIVGGNIGYGIGLSPDGNDGGFYYKPVVGYKIGDNTQLNFSYSGISVDGGTFSSLSLGFMFGL